MGTGSTLAYGWRVARPRTDQEKQVVASFVRDLFRASGYKTAEEWGSRAGVWGSNLSEYQSGKAMPDGYNLLRLMRAAGVELRGRDEAVDLPEGMAPRVPQAELPTAVGELLDWQTTAIEQLRQLDTRLSQLENAPASRRGSRRTGTDG